MIFFYRKILGINLVFLLQISFLFAQKAKLPTGLEIGELAVAESYHLQDNQRISDESGYPLAIYGLKYTLDEAAPEEMAKQFLREQNQLLGLEENDIQNLKAHAIRQSFSGTVVRLRQHKDGLPVNKAEITVNINKNNEVTYLMNGFRYDVFVLNSIPSISTVDAQTTAYKHLGINDAPHYEIVEPFIYHNKDYSRLAYRVGVMATGLIGEWEVLVDAITGEIFQSQDVSYYCNTKHKHDGKCGKDKGGKPAKMLVNGDGNVFDPDPLSSGMVPYGGGGYVDNDDANSADLTAQTFNVPLLDITFDGSNYFLTGPFAEIIDFENPSNGLYEQPTSSFLYTRFDDGFEAVNVYYHLDASMRYINNTLGINLMPYQYNTGVRVDPHGLNGSDNSYYSSGTGQLAFGEGCVDDAEDSDVVHHELGHGLHDWVTSGGLSQTDGLSEGCGDYWAQSYNRSLGNWTPADPAYNYVFNWDGHNPCWGGRTTAHTATYPGGLSGSIHTDGQIWATCLMKIYDIIGRAQTDKIFLEGLGMTNGSSDQNDAANAAYQAAINMGYSTSEINTIYNEFTSCGYTLPAPPTPPTAGIGADATTLCLDQGQNTVNFTDESTGSDATSWQWTFQGGTPATSTAQNPTVTYNASGVYSVELIATNSFGSDTLLLSDYITILTGAACPSCTTTPSTNVPIAIPSIGSITSTIDISDAGEIEDVNVLNLNGTHTRVSDLVFTLTSPKGTVVELIPSICGNNSDFDLSLDDSVADGIPCPYADGLTYRPSGALSDFNGEVALGTWTLTIEDSRNGRSGNLAGWSLEVCTSSNVVLSAKAMLEGPFNGTLQDDVIRASGDIPLIEPYSAMGFTLVNSDGGEVVESAVLNVTGNDAIVDWVFVELLDGTDPSVVLATRSALLQSDGDIVDTDGVSELTFANMGDGDYYIRIRHRNHLSIRTLDLVSLSAASIGVLDFTSSATLVVGTDARKDVGGVLLLWAGDANGDNSVNAADRSETWNNRNTTGYLLSDVNMDNSCNAADRSITWNNRNKTGN